MFGKSVPAYFCLVAVAAAAPAAEPQVAGYTNADAPFPETFSSLGSLANSFGINSQVPASEPSATSSAPLRSSVFTGFTSHGPYFGTPTTTGAADAPTTLNSSIGTAPPNPTATYYNTEGVPLNPMPAPYTPNGKFSEVLCLSHWLKMPQRWAWHQWLLTALHG